MFRRMRRLFERVRNGRGAAAFLLIACAVPALGQAVAGEGVIPARQRQLLSLLRDDCGACHGMRLTGGLGPALTPQALDGKPASSLAATVMSGRPGTAMPPWRRFMTEAEAEWLVARLMAGDTHVPR